MTDSLRAIGQQTANCGLDDGLDDGLMSVCVEDGSAVFQPLSRAALETAGNDRFIACDWSTEMTDSLRVRSVRVEDCSAVFQPLS